MLIDFADICKVFVDFPAPLRAAWVHISNRPLLLYFWICTSMVIDFADICKGFADIPVPLVAQICNRPF